MYILVVAGYSSGILVIVNLGRRVPFVSSEALAANAAAFLISVELTKLTLVLP
ncbi:hypothetical protein D3C80_2059630 [compost metagenome]